MKKIMILGAGIYPIPLIKQAKKMGIYTIVASIRGNYPGFKYADKIYYIDTTDYENILKAAKEENIDGIITAGTDVAVTTVGKVCDKLKLKGISYEAAEIANNKLKMKDVYEAAGVRTARYKKICFDDNIRKGIAGLNFPLIFKVVDSSGSRGIEKVLSPDEAETVAERIKQYTKQDYFIVEEFLVGEEFGAQAYIEDGEIKFILPHGDYVFQGDTGVPIGHFVPYNLDSQILDDAKNQLKKAAKAMLLDNCAMNVDFILCNGKTYVLEIGGRSGATCLSELVSIYYGFNYYEKMIRVSLGENVDFSSEKTIPCAAMLLKSDKKGEIVSQINNNSDENVLDVQFDYQVGDEIEKFRIGPNRIGHVIVTGKTIEQAVSNLNNALDNIQIIVK